MAKHMRPGSETPRAEDPTAEPSVGELVTQLSEQSSRLIRNELQLAMAEMQQKAKHAGVGAGMFGAAGIVALFGAGALTATAIMALALVLPGWLSGLLVAAALFLTAGAVALVGKRQLSQATPAAPKESIERVKKDVETLRGGARDGRTA